MSDANFSKCLMRYYSQEKVRSQWWALHLLELGGVKLVGEG